MHLPLEQHFPSVIDNTIREAFFKCPTKAQLGHFYSISPGDPSIHLHAGGAFASGLENARRAYYDRGESPESAVATGLEHLTRYWGTYESPDGATKTLPRMMEALVSYFDEYPLGVDRVVPFRKSEGGHAIEFTFAVPLQDHDGTDLLNPETGDPLLYGGRFDMLAVYDGSTLFAVDEKTSGSLGQQWAQQWDLNSQFTGYCWAANSYGYPVGGAIIRGVGILKSEIKHQQAVIYRPKWMIDRWYGQLVRDVKHMIHLWRLQETFNNAVSWGLPDAWPMALGGSCADYGGCPFKRLCLSPEPDNWLSDYNVRKWNPLSKDPEEVKNV